MLENDIKKQMDKVISHLENELWQLQVGRASTSMVDWINVYIPSWWIEQKLNQIANNSILDAQTIKIQPWDKSTISSIEKAIYDSWLWLTPINQWDHILINIPALTWERRKELTKVVSKMWEDAKVSLRNIRHDFIKSIKQEFEDKTISEDEKKQKEDKVDEITKEYTKNIDDHVKFKSDEIMTI